MVVSISPALVAFNDWFEKFLLKCLRDKTPSDDFLRRLSEEMMARAVDPSHFPEICKIILDRGCKLLHGSSALAFDYINSLRTTKCIDDFAYVEVLETFDAFERVDDVSLIVQNLCDVASTLSCPYTADDECVGLCQSMFNILKGMVESLRRSVTSTVDVLSLPNTVTELSDESAARATNSVLNGILFLRNDAFSHLLIFLYFDLISGRIIADEMPQMIETIRHCNVILVRSIGNSENSTLVECTKLMKQVCDNFPGFGQAPSLEWNYFREDFIYRVFRPAILTLGSIFATFRVLKSNEEIAESFLVVGDSLGMSRTQIIFDILRSGFLIQLETAASGQPEQRDREAMADMFVFLRIPLILAKMIDLGVSRADIFEALGRVSKCSTLLNELDAKKFHNTFRYIINELKQRNVLDEEQFNQLDGNRKSGIEQKPSLAELLCKDGDDSASRAGFQQSRVNLLRMAQKAKKVFETLDQDKNWMAMVPKFQTLMQSGEINLDLICSVCCADGDLSAFSSKLASINCQTQHPTDSVTAKNRVFMFDSTFILLSRIAMVWEDLRLEDLVGENTNGAFYLWMKKYTQCLDMNQTMPLESHLKMNFLNQMNLLKNSTPFWNETWDFASLIDHVPLIGDIILDEYKKEHHNEKEIHNILSTFRQMTCLLLCLVQWLETQPPSPARQAFAKTLRNFGNTRGQEPGDRWLYTMLVARKCSRQMAESRRQKEQPYTWVINFAQRQLPTVSQYQNEAPDLQMLKEAFLYSNQQSWASPDVIALINRCNKDVKQSKWCRCWMMQMLKSCTSDEMEVASELCLSAALTSPVPCLLEITHQLVDYVLFDFMTSSSSSSRGVPGSVDSSSFSSSAMNATSASSSSYHYQSNYVNIAINKTSATVLAKMLVRTLVLLLWAEDRRKLDAKVRAQRNAARKRKMNVEDGGESSTSADLSQTEEKQIKLECMETEEQKSKTSTSSRPESGEGTVLETIVKVFERFDNMIKGACLRPTVTFVIFFMHELAKSPKTSYRQRLIDLIPINMVFALARLDAAALPMSMFLTLYDINDEKYRLHCLKYACMMRKFELI